ncbi:hypothetical protein BUALT_Bualt15G0103200 [Buddleja alternifolia]|uniref:SWIM-type domain-containing protein n=1 Tax=Buddleja alternifolia TaxID=168488 RepID=A0AAV6WPT5_9LAMI|nr:hypothetical protein BUALT_Bualt15G0103200 [Buddleja alternifolia]
MSLRDPDFNDSPPPLYYPTEPSITIALHHGGQFSNRVPIYIGGSVSKFDYVDMNRLGFDYLDKLCEVLGYMGHKRYYNLQPHGFVLIQESHHVLQLCLLHEQDREVPIYLMASLDVLGSQVGTSKGGIEEPGSGCEDNDEESSENEDFTDSDYDIDNDVEDIDNDVEDIDNNNNEEDANSDTNVGNNELDSSDGEGEEDGGLDGVEIGSDSSDFDSGKDSDAENGENFPVFSTQDTYDPTFVLGMYFSSKSEFRKAFRSHAIRTRRNLKIIKNDLRRIYGKCAEAGCQWKIHVLAVGGESSFQVRDYNPKHSCGGMFHVKNCNSTWLGNKYEKSFRTDPKRNVKGWRQDVIEDINVHVSKNQAYRAKWRALKNIEGDPKDQYGRLWDYAEELRTSNPGSTVILTLAPDDGSGTPKFGKFYVCFKRVKDGFLSGCRKLIGVDGCHLKGPHGGILLAAVGIDPNNNSYPICYAVVNRETKESWEWFLTLLKFDLKIENDSEWTFLSDKQKGLIPAFEIVFPGSDNRFCVRHLFGNMKTAGFRGKAYKRAVWKAARASTISEFECRMQEMTKLDKNVVEWLHDKPPVNWSKSHFNTFSKCDLLLNNLCESFNSNILDAREKMILSMLEWIRAWLMGRLQENRDRCAKRWKGKICPKIKFLLMRNDEKTRDCIPLKATDYHYEIACPDGNCKVDLEKHTCSCRKWELSGIPCKHAICAINCQRLDPQDFVHPCYSVETYARVYMHCIYPVNGQEKWRKTGQVPLIPPNLGRGVGRPPSARRLEIGEDANKQKKKTRGRKKQTRMKRQQKSLKCSYCGETGHNKKGCQKRKDDIEPNLEANFEQEIQNAYVEAGDWGQEATSNGPNEAGRGQEPDWEQISMEVSNIESSIQGIDSQCSVQFSTSSATPVPTQDGNKLTARKRTKLRHCEEVAKLTGLKDKGKGKQTEVEPVSKKVGLKDKGKGKQTEAVPRKAGLSIRIQKNAPSTMTETRATFSILRSNSKQDSSSTASQRPVKANLPPKKMTRPPLKAQSRPPLKPPSRPPIQAPSRPPVQQPPRPPVQPPPSAPSRPPSRPLMQPPSRPLMQPPLSVSSSMPPPPRQIHGVKMRESTFAPEHPRVCVSLTTRKRKPILPPCKVIQKDGKKFVTMKNLTAAMNAKREEDLAKQGNK